MFEELILCLFINVANLLSVIYFFNINVSISKYLNFHLVNISFALDEYYISSVQSVMCSTFRVRDQDRWIDKYIDRLSGK